MLVRFSLVLVGGIEVISWTAPARTEEIVDSDLFSGFMEALQMFSEELGAPIRQLQLADLFLYIRTYGDYSIRLLVDTKLAQEYLERFFDDLARLTMRLLPEIDEDPKSEGNLAHFTRHYLPVLAPLIEQVPSAVVDPRPIWAPAQDKIALVGLGQAGKTTIKRQFLERWPAETIKHTAPTLGIDVTNQSLDFLEEQIRIFDFGGQEGVRQQHLARRRAWEHVSTLIFVVDLQDADRLPEAASYFEQVWALVTEANEKPPHLAFFLHKYDPRLHDALAPSLARALFQFNAHAPTASFHLTSVLDTSSSVALIRTLYFSLPAAMIKKLLEEGFLYHFKNDLLPCYASLLHESTAPIPEAIREEARKGAIKWGRSYGLSLQKSWLEYILGTYQPRARKLGTLTTFLEHEGRRLRITIPKMTKKGQSPALFTLLLDGILTGIAQTFRLISPRIVEDTEEAVVWEIDNNLSGGAL